MNPDKDGLWDAETKAAQSLTKNMCILGGGCHDAALADKAISDGIYDVICEGRSMLADPEWPNKVKEDRESDIVKCIRDMECTARLYAGLPVRCTQNENLGRERYMPEYWRPAIRKGYRRPIETVQI